MPLRDLITHIESVGRKTQTLVLDAGDFGRALGSLVEKPTHLLNAALVFFGALSAISITGSIVALIEYTEPKYFGLFRVSLAAFCAATVLHMLMVYHSLIECEDSEAFQKSFAGWVRVGNGGTAQEGSRWEYIIRLVAVALLLGFSGKLALEKLLPLESIALSCALAAAVFFFFAVWSVLAMVMGPFRERYNAVKQFLFVDAIAFFGWLMILLFYVTKNPWFSDLIIWIAFGYLLLVFGLRMVKWEFENFAWLKSLFIATLVAGLLGWIALSSSSWEPAKDPLNNPPTDAAQ